MGLPNKGCSDYEFPDHRHRYVTLSGWSGTQSHPTVLTTPAYPRGGKRIASNLDLPGLVERRWPWIMLEWHPLSKATPMTSTIQNEARRVAGKLSPQKLVQPPEVATGTELEITREFIAQACYDGNKWALQSKFNSLTPGRFEGNFRWINFKRIFRN